MNKSVLDMVTVQCNSYDIVEQMKSFWRASNGSEIIISICFFSVFKNYPFRLLINFAGG